MRKVYVHFFPSAVHEQKNKSSVRIALGRDADRAIRGVDRPEHQQAETSAAATNRCGFTWHGFGNLSVRSGTTNNFYITGSATAGISELDPSGLRKGGAYDFERNWLQYEGRQTPSSESLTHAAVYESDTKSDRSFHCHDSSLWRALLNEASGNFRRGKYGRPRCPRNNASF